MLGGDSETRLLEESLGVVNEQSYLMRQAMETGNIRDVLKHSSALIGELRTSSLPPRKYYELYMQIFQELQRLHSFFNDRVSRRRRLSELYESVQHAGNVLPRLYLVICVGSACINEREISPRESLIDLNELCKGVQHPLRGLFLRYFLVQMIKNVLPDCGDPEYPDWPAPVSPDGSTPITSAGVSFEFLFNNCVEASKLWTRIQFQSPSQDKTKRESDRHSLRVLVGANLVCMSQLDCISIEYYKEIALPKILSHIKGSKDIMAQQYLLECIIQVFSDEYHVATIPALFNGFIGVSSAVDVKLIISNLFNRLKTFLSSPELFSEEEGKTSKPSGELTLEKNETDSNNVSKDNPSISLVKSRILEGENSRSDDNVDASTDVPATSSPKSNNSPILNGVVESSSEVSHPNHPGGTISPSHRSEHPQAPSTQKEASSAPSKRSAQTFAVFAGAREGLMDLIQKAYDEDFQFPPPPPPIPNKPSSISKAPPIYRLTVSDILQILQSFLDFILSVFPGRVDLADSLYQLVYPLIGYTESPISGISDTESQQATNKQPSDEAGLLVMLNTSQALGFLLSEPFRRSGYLNLINGKHYSKLLECLNNELKKSVSREIVKAILKSNDSISDASACTKLYSLLSFVIASPRPNSSIEINQWRSEVESTSAICHLIRDEDTDVQFSMLLTVKQSLMLGHPDTYQYTLPSLIVCWLSLIPKIQIREQSTGTVKSEPGASIPSSPHQPSPAVSPKEDHDQPPPQQQAAASPLSVHTPEPPGITSRRVLQEVHGVCVELMERHPELTFRLLLLAAEATAQADQLSPGSYGIICNEFLKQALVCYEEDLTDNRCRVKALPLLVSLLSTSGIICLDSDAYDSMAEKATRYAAKLLKSPDQCRAVLLCSHLFWDGQNRDISRVLECLQRCLKLATEAIQFNIMDVVLFVDILEKYLFFFEHGPDINGIPPETISSLMGLCAEQLAFAESSSSLSSETARNAIHAAQKHLSNLVNYIRAYDRLDVNSKFHEIDISFMS